MWFGSLSFGLFVFRVGLFVFRVGVRGFVVFVWFARLLADFPFIVLVVSLVNLALSMLVLDLFGFSGLNCLSFVLVVL